MQAHVWSRIDSDVEDRNCRATESATEGDLTSASLIIIYRKNVRKSRAHHPRCLEYKL